MSEHAVGDVPAPGPRLDREALLVALVLAPATYSRNRFYDLYRDPEMRRLRRRASTLRAMLRQLARDPAIDGPEEVRLTPLSDGGSELSYVVPALGLRRTARLDALELAVVRFALGRAGRCLPALEGDTVSDRTRIEVALARLAPTA